MKKKREIFLNGSPINIRFLGNAKQYNINYKGFSKNMDIEEFKPMSDEGIKNLIISSIKQTPKKRQEEDIVPHDEGRELFKAGLKKIKPENFREFYDLMSNA
jgi:hypothetical protein